MTTLLRLFVASLRRASSRLRARLARKLAALSKGAARLLASGVPGGLAQRLCQVAVACGLAAVVAGGISTVAQAGGPGNTIIVNTYETGAQTSPAIARDADGDTVVVWQSQYQYGGGWNIYAQRLTYNSNADGMPAGHEFRVNTETGSHELPDVAMDADGDFVVVWQAPDGNATGVYGRRFSAEGVPQGGEFRINQTVTGQQTRPRVSMDAAGNFVVVWNAYLQPGDTDRDVYGRVYNADGTARTGQFRMNTAVAGDQSLADVAMAANGNFVAVWHSASMVGGNSYDVAARLYNPDGTPATGEFIANQTVSGWQFWPTVACDVDGDFVVAWQAYQYYSSYYPSWGNVVMGRRFAADGTPEAGEFRISQPAIGGNYNWNASVSMDADGDFVATWNRAYYYSWFSSISSYGYWYENDVMMRVYRADGSNVVGVTQVFSNSSYGNTMPVVAMDYDGDFVIAWQESYYSDIRARGYTTYTAYDSSYDYDNAGPWVANLYVAGDHHRVTDGERLAQNTIDRLTIAFAEELDETAANNAANYSLTRDGANVPIGGVHYFYAQVNGRYEVRLTFGAPLGDGDYVLRVRDTVTDLEGNALDGNFDGVPGGDYVINFTVNATRRQGGEFRVNTTTAGAQTRSDIAMDADGNFVVVWQGVTYSGSSSSSYHYDIYAQRYNASGAPQGPEFVVNSISTGDQKNPAVAMDADGNFIVVWDGFYYSTYYSSQAIIGRRFAANGTPLDTFDVFIEGGTNGQEFPDVAMDAAGNFVVAWTADIGFNNAIEANVFNADFSSRFGGGLVSGDVANAKVAMDADGDFIIVWSDFDYSFYFGNTTAVMAARFTRDGDDIPGLFGSTPWPVTFSVLPFPYQGVVNPEVAMDADGDFVVTWTEIGFIVVSSFAPFLGGNVKMARFSSNGAPEGLLFQGTQVNDIPNGALGNAVSMDADGDIVVTWTQFHGYLAPMSYGSFPFGTEADVYVKRFNAQGQAQETDVRVNTFRRGNQQRSNVAMDADGDFVVVWISGPSYLDQNAEQDGSKQGIYGQRFDMNSRPTVSGIPDQTMDEDDDPRIINLAAFFSDAEDGASGLTYTIVGNTNPALVVPSFDGTNLVLALVPDAHGTADISIRATDAQGLWVEDTFTLTVNPVDELVAFITKTKKERGCAAESTGTAPWGLLAVFAVLLGSLRSLVRRKQS